jgi:hypothetical protein
MMRTENIGIGIVTLALLALAWMWSAAIVEATALAGPPDDQGRVPAWLEEERCSSPAGDASAARSAAAG